MARCFLNVYLKMKKMVLVLVIDFIGLE